MLAPDTIFGFASGEDKIDLRPVRTSFADTVGIAYLNGASFIFVDIGGNGTNDMLIQVESARVLLSDLMWASPTYGNGPGFAPVESMSDMAIKEPLEAMSDHHVWFMLE